VALSKINYSSIETVGLVALDDVALPIFTDNYLTNTTIKENEEKAKQFIFGYFSKDYLHRKLLISNKIK
jgi:hypothetical protein